MFRREVCRPVGTYRSWVQETRDLRPWLMAAVPSALRAMACALRCQEPLAPNQWISLLTPFREAQRGEPKVWLEVMGWEGNCKLQSANCKVQSAKCKVQSAK